MSSADRHLWLAAATAAAQVAADFIAHEARTHRAIAWEAKSATDFVSHVDLGAEERIRDVLLSQVPDLRVVGEELSNDADPETGLVAIVDPLDGTTNFLHGFPSYGVSICIALDGVPQAAVIHDVARGGIYTAAAGTGAHVNGQPMHVSSIVDPARALIGTGFPFRDVSYAERYLGMMRRLMPVTAGMRRAGSAALDLTDVANGRFDGFWELWLNPWDLAAGVLLVREAGGRVTDLDGHDARLIGGPVVASNGVLHDWFLDILNDRTRAPAN
ncbi:inositol monophosphatase family protein [Gemmatimonas sp.]|jgi:myo-inositol-1(or 4)-monophosphatase|uniref:inositol monophosphatase family protein n=1 Tax=Gemmatimonas sp. TaxID=1962908 RepID=UPI0022C24119|nr:inositol monophosphatase family protein [Gemmatimonas sp.]MCZ8205143.1 inositol monophosphatase family protein [Gemmatimonas sp.]